MICNKVWAGNNSSMIARPYKCEPYISIGLLLDLPETTLTSSRCGDGE
jgi:hypothetical protein